MNSCRYKLADQQDDDYTAVFSRLARSMMCERQRLHGLFTCNKISKYMQWWMLPRHRRAQTSDNDLNGRIAGLRLHRASNYHLHGGQQDTHVYDNGTITGLGRQLAGRLVLWLPIRISNHFDKLSGGTRSCCYDKADRGRVNPPRGRRLHRRRSREAPLRSSMHARFGWIRTARHFSGITLRWGVPTESQASWRTPCCGGGGSEDAGERERFWRAPRPPRCGPADKMVAQPG